MHDCIGKKYIVNGKEKRVALFANERLTTNNPVYEVIRIVEGIPLFIEDHLDRLESSFRISKRTYRFEREKLIKLTHRLVSINQCEEGAVKYIFDESGYILHLMKLYLPKPHEYKTGVKTIFFEAERQTPNAKVWNGFLREKIVKAMQDKDAYEAILIDQEGFITEGSRSNVFFIREDKVFTTPSDLVLQGITRQKVMMICRNLSISVTEERVGKSKVSDYDALFLTGTTRKIVVVRSIDECSFSVENDLVKLITHEFEQLVADYVRKSRMKQIKSGN